MRPADSAWSKEQGPAHRHTKPAAPVLLDIRRKSRRAPGEQLVRIGAGGPRAGRSNTARRGRGRCTAGAPGGCASGTALSELAAARLDPKLLVDDRTTGTLPDAALAAPLLFKRSGASHDGTAQLYFGKLLAHAGLR